VSKYRTNVVTKARVSAQCSKCWKDGTKARISQKQVCWKDGTKARVVEQKQECWNDGMKARMLER
jgi:hypothetical protein